MSFLFDRLNRRRKLSSVIKIVFGVLLSLSAALLIWASAVFKFGEWHDLDPSLITECPQALRFFDSDGNLICVMGKEKRIWIGLDEIPKHTVDAFVASEDNRFYTHSGIDLYRIFGAAWADIKAGSYVQGASTISQQLIKLSHLSSEKTLDRKLEEAVLATQLEKRFTKDEIMEMYLNYIYFGGGYYGIEAASLGYFGVHARDLSIAQSAQLAGILKSPTAYAPHIDPDASVRRRDNVLRLMFEGGYINSDQYEAAKEEECVLDPALPVERSALTDHAFREAQDAAGLNSEELLSGGYSIVLTMNSDISSICSELMDEESLFPTQNAQGALVVIDRSGGISAMIGGRGEYTANGLNRAADIERQPGSLIKPILVYAPALELEGKNPSTVLYDAPRSFGDYSPRNSDEKYYGNVTLRTAVTKSLNIPAVSILSELGIERAVSFAERLGVSFENEELSLPLALGGFTYGVSPLEVAGAYSAFSRGGEYIKPYSVTRVLSSKGDILFEREIEASRVMSEENAFLLTSMLQSVASEGTGKRLAGSGVPLAAKTGTSIDENGVRDAWCAAYTTEFTAVAWMGTDSAEMGSLPETAVGGGNTAVLLAEVFGRIYSEYSYIDFTEPEGVTGCYIDLSELDDGFVYAASDNTPEEYLLYEYYVDGEEPTEEDPYWSAPIPPDEAGWSISAEGLPVISFSADNDICEYVIIRTDLFGEEKTVYASSGGAGLISFTDADVMPGGTYTYVIYAVHPKLRYEDGSRVMSEPSRKLYVVVPFGF